MDLDLRGRRAFVSGSTRGIGRAIAEALLREGATVVIHGREEERVRKAVDALRAEAPDARVEGVAADLADPAQVRNLVERLGDVDILVNNAGVFDLADVACTSDDEWQRSLDVNLMSGVRLSRSVLGGMLSRGWGRIIFIASESGVNVPGDMIPYGVTKAAMLALGNGLAKLTRGTRVTVNTILGGPTRSDGVDDAIAQLAQARSMAADDVADAIAAENRTSLLQRFIDPAEIADLAVYLASPRSSATNGAALRADGGTLTTIL